MGDLRIDLPAKYVESPLQDTGFGGWFCQVARLFRIAVAVSGGKGHVLVEPEAV
jgi:hypothetical protein